MKGGGKSAPPEVDICEVTVATIPLREVFSSEGVTRIDYLSIDVEGHELQVLEGIDFDGVRIMVLTIESSGGRGQRFGDPCIQSFLKKKGLRYFARIAGMDDIFVNPDMF